MICRLAVAFAVACGLLALVGCATDGSQTSSSISSQKSPEASSQASSDASSVSAAASTASSVAVLPESEWGNLFPTLGDGAVAFGQRVQNELPVKAYACWQGEGGGEPILFESPDDIAALFNALASSGVGGKATTVSTDDYTSFGFKFADDAGFSFMFDSMTVMVDVGDKWEFYDVDPSPALASYAAQAWKHTMSQYE